VTADEAQSALALARLFDIVNVHPRRGSLALDTTVRKFGTATAILVERPSICHRRKMVAAREP
jgi:hypothetical protein